MMTCAAPKYALLLAGLLALQFPAHARPADSKAKQASKKEIPIHDFAALAQHRPRACAAGAEARPLAPWRGGVPSCAWSGRLEMRRWELAPSGGERSCVSAPARWWAWERRRFGVAPDAAGGAWRAAWASQSLAEQPGKGQTGQGQAGQSRRIAILDRAKGGAWVATEWTWHPSPRAATRTWQQSRWKLLEDGAARLRAPASGARQGREAALLGEAWEQNLNGGAGDALPDGWQWQAGGVCMHMVALPPNETGLRLPYAREDARLEQRAAMQVLLARRHPQAAWPVPFRLLPLAPGALRAGAIYAAVRAENTSVAGQLWIPSKQDAGILRAAVQASLPAPYESAAGLAAGAAASVAIERELTGIANHWSALHER